MAKDNITDWDTAPDNNEDVGGIDIRGTAKVSNFDNGLREVMAQIADVNAGNAPVADTWSFADPADLTKIVRFDAGNITAGNTRVLTMTDSNLDLANLPRVDASQSFSQSQINQLLTNAGVQIRQIAVFSSATSGSTSSNTSYSATFGAGQTVTPKSATSKLLVICSTSVDVTRSAGGLFGSMRLHYYNGSAWGAPSGAVSLARVGQNSAGTTSTDVSGTINVFAVLGSADKDGGDWRFVLCGNVSTTGSSPLLSVTAPRYIAIELEGL
jgi:hypothetical protein